MSAISYNAQTFFGVKATRLLLVILVFGTNQQLQSQCITIPINVEKVYKKNTRNTNGAAGKNYWQNTAKYNLKIKFHPNKRLIEGFETIVYFNNSPDTLNRIWIKLFPNLYMTNAQRQVNINAEDLNSGMKIDDIIINGVLVDKSNCFIDVTNMIIKINPLISKQTLNIAIKYSYILNKGSHYRTGQVDDGSFFVAYFFPRIAVYDDIDGWNQIQYTGSYEFYNDFCDFEVEINVPKKYIVWATGDLTNSLEVLNPEIIQKLKHAESSNEVVDIIDSIDQKNNKVTTKSTTWKFTAKNVTDFVFGTSNHYLWKSTSLVVDSATGRRTRVDAVFNNKHKDFYDVINQAQKTVSAMSFDFPKWPFPYHHETVFDGLDQMEYPMMVNDNPLDDHSESIELTDHEIMHTMFPFYMGINETKYGWMDEGWATIGEWIISPLIDSSIVDTYGIDRYEAVAGTDLDIPVMTPTTHLIKPSMFINSYAKPAMAYLYLKDMLGDEVFFKALHYYIGQWHGKHPMPFDFFNCMNAGSGQNLNWFFQRWFFDNGYPDLGIKNVLKSGNKYEIQIHSTGTRPLPIDINVLFDDNTTLKLHRNVSCWKDGNKDVFIEFETLKKPIKAMLGSTYIPDINKSDNTYTF